jgi:adenylate cyclase
MKFPHLLTIRRIRLLTGLVMFAYLTQHLLNHALGVVSLPVAEGALSLAIVFWRNPAATVVLYGAAATHFALALWTLYSRREWRLPLIEIVRLAAGFSFPLLLIGHAVTTRLGHELFDLRPSYTSTLASLAAAGSEGMQLALLAPGWLHGCLGLWITLRRFEAMQRAKPLLVALVVLVPLMAAFGFWRMSVDVAALGPPPAVGPEALERRMMLLAWKDRLTTAYLAAIATAFLLGRLTALTRRPTG